MIENIRWARLSLALVSLTALAWLVPDLTYRATRPEFFSLGAFYSDTTGDFVYRESNPLRSRFAVIDADASDRTLSKPETAKALPFLFRRDLERAGETVSVAGVDYPDRPENGVQISRTSPALMNAAPVRAAGLLETEGDVLVLPQDLLLVRNDELVFFNTETYAVDPVKTRAVMAAIDEAGLRLPLRDLASNPNTRKPYDEGALLVDADGKIGRIRLVDGRLSADVLVADPPVEVLRVTVEEDPRREYAGLAVSRNAVHLVRRDGELVSVATEDYDAYRDSLSILSTPVSRTVTQSTWRPGTGALAMRFTALSVTDGSKLAEVERALPDLVRDEALRIEALRSFLSPFCVTLRTPLTSELTFSVRHSGATLAVLAGGLFWAALAFFVGRRMARSVRGADHRAAVLFALLFGLPGLLAAWIACPLVRSVRPKA